MGTLARNVLADSTDSLLTAGGAPNGTRVGHTAADADSVANPGQKLLDRGRLGLARPG